MIEVVNGRACIVLPVSPEDAEILRALDLLWARIRQQDDRLPATVAFSLTPGRGSSCTSVGWDEPTPVIEVNLLDDGQVITGAELAERVIHLAAHALSVPTSAGEGRYHSHSYREEARGLLLDVAGYGAKGWNATTLSKAGQAAYAPEIRALSGSLKDWTPTVVAKSARSSRNGVSAHCSCSPPRRIRVTESTFDLGGIRCEVCGQPFKISET